MTFLRLGSDAHMHLSVCTDGRPAHTCLRECVCVSVGIYILLSSSEVGANRQQRTFLDCGCPLNLLLACNNFFIFYFFCECSSPFKK